MHVLAAGVHQHHANQTRSEADALSLPARRLTRAGGAQISTVVIAERVDPLAVQYAAVTRAATMAIAPRAKFFALPVAYAHPVPFQKA